jgi:uncharacterized protein
MALGDEKYILFTTFKRDGTAVSTPTWIVALDDGRHGFWTSSGSGKAKRLAHTARVTVQPCDARGKVKGATVPVDATAELVTGAQLDEITAKVKAKYGFVTHITKLLGTIGGIVKRNRIPYGDRGVVVDVAADADANADADADAGGAS